MNNEFENNYDYYNENLEYDNQDTNGFGAKVYDAIGHGAQGVAFGWGDELMGLYGGVGRVMANGIMRGLGYSVNGESFADAWNKGYTDYRDFARQELERGSERNPYISAGSEIAGSVISPVKFKSVKGARGPIFGKIHAHPTDVAKTRWINAIASGTAYGVGDTNIDGLNMDTMGHLAGNIATNVATNYLGTTLGNHLYGSGNQMYQMGRSMMNAGANALPYFWGNDDEETETF